LTVGMNMQNDSMQSSFLLDSIGSTLIERQQKGDPITQIISPFIQNKAFEKLIVNFSQLEFVITRWNSDDIVNHVSDLEVFVTCKENNLPLFLNSDLHAKIFCFSSGEAFIGSSNLTQRGLGLSKQKNIEAGVFATISIEQEIAIRGIRDSSQTVTEEYYLYAKHWLQNAKRQKVKLQPLLPLENEKKEFLLSLLPYSKTPAEFIEMYNNRNFNTQNDKANFVNDCISFKVGIDSDKSNIKSILANNFRLNPFIQKFTEYLKNNNSLRFGKVSSLIHNWCEDVPTPSRREVKEVVNTLYNWLDFFYDEITWDIPRHSQVIYWNKGK